jgi:hypothetical protein
MRRVVLALAAAVPLSTLLRGADPAPQNFPIVVTINPEARVSAALAGPMPQAHPGTPVDLPVKVVNLGFVTATLEAELVGDAVPGAALEFHPEPLKGLPVETRMLRLTLKAPGTVDLTMAFRTHNEIPDLGGRDRIHFLMVCR